MRAKPIAEIDDVESSARVPVIRNYRVSHVAEVVREGINDPALRARAEALCKRFDVGGLLTVPVRQMLELLEEVAAASGLDDLGLRVGARYHPADWGAYGYLFLNSPTVLQALKSWVRVTREEQQGTHAALVLSDDAIRLEYSVRVPALRLHRQDSEMTLAVLTQAVRAIAGAATRPREVHFEHTRPRNTAPHRAFFGSALRFGMGVNAIIFDRRLAGTPVVNADPQLLLVISHFIGQARRGESADLTLPELVESALRPLLASGSATLGAVVKRLGMSVRTVQRQLSDAGTTFERCLEAVRLARALELLSDPQLEVKEIAFLLGFSGNPAFSRAFNRWTGMSPRVFRASGSQVRVRPKLYPSASGRN